MRRAASIILTLWAVLATTVLYGANNPNTYPVIDVMAYPGVDPTGATMSTTGLQAAFTTAGGASGGLVRFPCGVFKSTALTIAIAAAQHVTLQGSGQDCTELRFIAANGITETWGSAYSSADINDMSLTTDQTGGYTALSWTQAAANTNPAVSGHSGLNRVKMRGRDAYGAGQDYWGTGWNIVNVSNITANNLGYQGGCSGACPSSTYLGTGISWVGDTTASTYAVVLNLTNPIFNNCNTGLYEGDYTQGLSAENMNATHCGYGFNQISNPIGGLTELQFVGGQFYNYVCAICVQDPQTAGLLVTGAQIAVTTGGLAIKIQGEQYAVTGNNIAGPSLYGVDVGISVASNPTGAPQQGGSITGNSITGFSTAIAVAASVDALVKMSDNHINNSTTEYTAGALNYSIGSGASNVMIIDRNLNRFAFSSGSGFAVLPTCTNSIIGSDFLVYDSANITFYGSVSPGGGTGVGWARCTGSQYLFH